jgi:hypothetical protein
MCASCLEGVSGRRHLSWQHFVPRRGPQNEYHEVPKRGQEKGRSCGRLRQSDASDSQEASRRGAAAGTGYMNPELSASPTPRPSARRWDRGRASKSFRCASRLTFTAAFDAAGCPLTQCNTRTPSHVASHSHIADKGHQVEIYAEAII